MSEHNAGDANMKRNLVRIFREKKNALVRQYRKDAHDFGQNFVESDEGIADLDKINLLKWVIEKTLEA